MNQKKSLEPDLKPWSLAVTGVSSHLETDEVRGLSAAEARRRLEEKGPNLLREEKTTPALVRFLHQFRSPVVIALLLATLVSFFLGSWVDSIAILVIVFLNALISLYQEHKAVRAIAMLKELSAPKARVRREGRVREVPAFEVCVGDVLVLEAGDYIAADARVVEARQLMVTEAALTGESLPVEKTSDVLPEVTGLNDRTNMLHAGTALVGGTGAAVVTRTGMGTELGKIAALLEAAQTVETPMQKSLESLGRLLLILSCVIVLAIALLGVARGVPWINVVMSAVSLAVAAIPEGLPAVVTLALTLAVRRMARRNAIVRELPSVEALGSTDVICTDKTGTLTTGQMSVREWSQFGSRTGCDLQSLLEAAVLCSNASIEGETGATGDPTEVALLRWARSEGVEPEALHHGNSRLYEWSFDSGRKRMSVLVEPMREDEARTTPEEPLAILYVKGAPESVLTCCATADLELAAIEERIQELSARGFRLLALAKRPGSRALIAKTVPEVETELEFLGLVAIADPPRQETRAAIRACHAAGIKVVMITGDHPVTAHAIAQELGILEPGRFDAVLSGNELALLNDEELNARVESTAVYARVAPEDKVRVVRAWQDRGKVVAMTGDGVNDAPALKAASVGIAMGRGGTEVARQASAIILTNDDFATIVAAVEEGRGVFGNIRRTVEYLLAGNLAEIVLMLGAALAGWHVPLAPIQLLWINLVTDGLPALALASERVEKDILLRTGRPSTKSFADLSFYRRTIAIGLLVGAMAIVIYGTAFHRYGPDVARSLTFSFLVFEELFRSFAFRSESRTFLELGPRSNLLLLGAVTVPLLFQLSLHHLPHFQQVFKTLPTSPQASAALIALALVPVGLIEVAKLLKRTPH